MTAVVFILLAAMFFLAAAHPFLIYPWTLMRFPQRASAPRQEVRERPRPSLAICMSVYNEEKVIKAKAEGLIAMADAYGPAEILIYVDGNRDRTLDILQEYRDRIRIVSSLERRGKTVGLKRLVGLSSSELLAFTDANVVAPIDGLISLQAAMADPSVGCASARLVYTNPEETETSHSGAAYWSIEETLKARESRTFGVIGVDGALFMVRRDAYEEPPDDIIDDLFVSLAALTKGYHVISVPGVVVEERSATSVQEEFRRKVRISCQSMNVHRLMWPRLRQLPAGRLYGYISHRLLKWFLPYTMLAGSTCLVVGMFASLGVTTTSWALLLLVALFALCLVVRARLAVRAAVYCLLLAGVGVGVFESLVLGRRYVTWRSAITVRAM